MYGLVLLAALSGAEGAAGFHKHYPAPMYDNPWCYPGYHNHGGWGLPYGGYGWPGFYTCWGAGGHAGAPHGVPMTPLIIPRPPYAFDRDEEKDKDDKDRKDRKKDNGDEDKDKKKKDKEGDDKAARARVTFLLPAGAKLYVDGAEVKASDVKTFRTPALEWGETYYYEVKAEVVRDGKPVSENRRITLKAGANVRADFRTLGDAAVSTAKK